MEYSISPITDEERREKQLIDLANNLCYLFPGSGSFFANFEHTKEGHEKLTRTFDSGTVLTLLYYKNCNVVEVTLKKFSTTLNFHYYIK